MTPAGRRDSSRTFERIATVLGSVSVRVLLSTAIIVSLLPFEWATRLDTFFLILFGVEFGLRATLLFRVEGTHIYAPAHSPLEQDEPDRRWRWPRFNQLILLVFDLFALLSFLPVQAEGSSATRWLRMFRLSRMLLLFSYWAPLVRDAWGVLLRGERGKQVVLMGFIVLVLSFSGAVVIEHVGEADPIDFDGNGRIDDADRRFFVHLWWAFRQVQDPGNMLSAPSEAVVVVVSLALTIVGLFMVSFLIGLGTDVVRELLELTRLRSPGLRGHTVVVNIDPSTQQLLHMLMSYSKKLTPGGRVSLGWIRKLLRNTTARGLGGARFVVVGDKYDPPDFMRRPDLSDIVYRQAPVGDDSFVARTDTLAAQRIVLLADLTARDPDAETIQALLTITQSLSGPSDPRRSLSGPSDPRRSLSGPSDPRRSLSGPSDPRPRSTERSRTSKGHSSAHDRPVREDRKRLLIAEILDESNVPAARRAITAGIHAELERTRAFVIPTERLIALFIACITRRPGCEVLLEELLTSTGHELYTCFFDEKGLGYCEDRRPPLPERPDAVMAKLIAKARALPAGQRVVPVGLFRDPHTPDGELQVFINPATTRASEPASEAAAEPEPAPVEHHTHEYAGFIAIAGNFKRVRALSELLFDSSSGSVPAPSEPPADLPEFEFSPTTRLDRVLVCGFRNGTVSMVEALIKAQPSTQILIMVQDQQAYENALDDFEAHSKLVERELLSGNHGQFRRVAEQPLLHWLHPDEERAERGHIYLAVGDWSSSRKLAALPFGFGRVAELDAVILVSCERSGSDARTAKTLMKLETLVVGERGPRVVAEVLDVDFARRLRERGRKRAGHDMLVYSIQELRAFFMFQAVVVPAFDQVYAELMGPWGQSFVKLMVSHPGRGTCSFESLADHLAGRGQVLVGIEIESGSGSTTLMVAEGDPDLRGRIDLARLVAVWVVSDEPAHSAGG